MTRIIPTISLFIVNVSESNADGFGTELSSSTTPDYSYGDPEDGYGMCFYEQHGASFLPVLYSIFFVLGVIGNSLVIWVIICGVRLRSMTDVCLLNLALADMLLVCSLPFLAHQARDQWLFGDGMCKAVLGVYHIVFYSGIFFISLMSIDRYLAIVHAVYAIRARTRFFGMIAAVVTWFAGFLASFPELLYLKEQSVEHGTLFCFPEYPEDDFIKEHSNHHFWRIFKIFKMNVFGLFIPIFIMTFCYSQIINKLLHTHSSKKQAIRLVLLVVVVFFCCWVPFNVASFFKALELMHIYTGCERSKAIMLTLQVTEAIAYSHSCLNPILYVFVGKKFREQLLRLINRAPCRLCQLIKVCIPQDRLPRSFYSQTTSLDERSTAV